MDKNKDIIEIFLEMFQGYSNRLFEYICRRCGERYDSMDIVQEVFYEFWLALTQKSLVRDKIGYLRWIYKTASYKLNEYFRKRAKDDQVFETRDFDEQIDLQEAKNYFAREATELPQGDYDIEVLIPLLRERLNAEEKLLFDLLSHQRFSNKEIAMLLRVNEDTVKMRIFRLKKKLLVAIKEINLESQ